MHFLNFLKYVECVCLAIELQLNKKILLLVNKIESSGRTDIEFHNIRQSEEDRLELIKVGGKQQVPCLFVDGVPMYESDEIVAWLKENPEK